MVEYDVSFSQKNFIVSINCFSGIGSHRAKLVDIIFPGMLAVHAGLYSVVSGGTKSEVAAGGGSSGASGASAGSGASDTACVWSPKQAKSISNMNKNNMLKMLKFTSSVPWHEDLVLALSELGAKEKAEKAQELSQEAAISVSGSKRNQNVDLDDDGQYNNRLKRPRVEQQHGTMAAGREEGFCGFCGFCLLNLAVMRVGLGSVRRGCGVLFMLMC